jgi:PKD repeat protein
MSAAGSSDQDGDVLTYAWTFGDGSSATGVTVSHTYQQAGTFTVRLIVTDTGGLADTTSTTATVLTRSQALGQAIELVEQLQGRLNAGNANALVVKLEAAQKQFERDNFSGALGPLYSLLKQMAAFVRTGKLTEADAAELQELVGKVIASTQ